ncbi:unnamed protein product [Miscanthus lutarioriparius]|uniref:RING-type domain-containing protein n=1 Tax=Miscanthus lutarioriparius TaxID=422564 RepID=A0A811N1A3_9POAL|nr:unnamed protein product [Miscanthus lutarioriparius]
MLGLPSLAAAGLVLLLLYLTGRFLWLYNKDTAQAAAASASSSSSRWRPAAAAGASTSLPAASPLPRRAVPLSSSSSLLPVFFVLHVAVSGPGAETAECAVCLTEFGEREAGRLLPWCGHAYHEQCIATWLRVSTTCPLCRAPVATK